jgi:hypothetical protein
MMKCGLCVICSPKGLSGRLSESGVGLGVREARPMSVVSDEGRKGETRRGETELKEHNGY